MTTYNLPNVKPHVVAAANEIGTRFGIKTIGGWRAHDPFPDHPSGLALDFMINNLSADAAQNKAVGDAIAAYVIANAARLSVKYMIWYRRSWNPQRGTWVPYTSTTNPHTDHVHVTFLPQPGTGGPIIDTVDTNPTGLANLSNPVDEYKQIMSVLDSSKTAFAWLSDTHNWLRILYVVVGASLVIGLLVVMFFHTDAPGIIGDVITG